MKEYFAQGFLDSRSFPRDLLACLVYFACCKKKLCDAKKEFVGRLGANMDKQVILLSLVKALARKM